MHPAICLCYCGPSGQISHHFIFSLTDEDVDLGQEEYRKFQV